MTTATMLSPAEALVMLSPRLRAGREAVKVTLLALLAQRLVTIETVERKVLGFSTRQTVLKVAPSLPALLPQPARALIEVVRANESLGGSMKTFVAQARRQFGPDLGKFEQVHILPALAARGLVQQRVAPVLFVFKRTVWLPTAQGVAEQQRLQGLLAQARDIPRALDDDPRRAAAMAVALGGLILIAPELKAYFGQIAAAMRAPQPADAGGDSTSASTDTGTPLFDHHGIADTSALDQAGSFDLDSLDLSAIDTLDSSMNAFDSSFDAAASDAGGSDGGGGDGGGGGGD